MSSKLITGAALLVVGLILLYLGYTETQTVGGSLSRALGGGLSTKAILLLGAGGVATVLGALTIKKNR